MTDSQAMRCLCTAPVTVMVADSLPSTNTVLKADAADRPDGFTVAARSQTAGRGQRGNSWEAAAGMNLTFSMLLHPRSIPPARQFLISEAVAVAIARTLDAILPQGMRAEVKWPNDIYVGSRKICGILIEHSICSAGKIGHTIAGVGINVNQTEFLSDAPNPVSLAGLTGRRHDLDDLLVRFAGEIFAEFRHIDSDETGAAETLHEEFMARLWRHDGGLHPFLLPGGTPFSARIRDVAHDGLLTLEDAAGELHTFYFKEVAFVV